MMLKPLKSIGSAVVLCGIIAGTNLTSNEAKASCVPEPYIGSVCYTAANFCPRDYVPMFGQLLAIADYNALFALVSNLYGGDGRVSFGVPDARGRIVIGSGQGPGLLFVPVASRRGSEATVLTHSQLTLHDHDATFTPDGGSSVAVNTTVEVNDAKGTSATPDATNRFLGVANDGKAFGGSNYPLYNNGSSGNKVALGSVTSTASGGSTSGIVAIGDTGSSDAFPIIDPSVSFTPCIAVDGLFPPRS